MHSAIDVCGYDKWDEKLVTGSLRYRSQIVAYQPSLSAEIQWYATCLL